MKYKGLFKHTNPEPTGDNIEVFCSDWNKDYWGFYAYIEKDNYEEDIEEINNLISKLNWRDGDVYIELINYSGDLENFYKYLYDSQTYSHSNSLNPRYWELLEEKGGDSFFLYFNKLKGSTYLSDLESAEFSTFEDWYEVLEVFNPDLYKALDSSNGLCCFDIEHFYKFQGFTEVEGVIVLESD